MEIMDSVDFNFPTTNLRSEKFVLSKKNGKHKLVVKSPLFENYFKEQSKGEITLHSNSLWGVPQYRFQIDPNVQAELLRLGVQFGEMKTFWQRRNDVLGGGGPYFNISFLSCVGLGQGLSFPIKDMVPLSLLEGPDYVFNNNMKRGLYYLVKQFLQEYEASISFTSHTEMGKI
jgi:hypothetical protein